MTNLEKEYALDCAELREFAVNIICMPRPQMRTEEAREKLNAIIDAALDAAPPLKVPHENPTR